MAGVAYATFELVRPAGFFQQLAHNGRAGRGSVRRVSPTVGAASVGLCALKIALSISFLTSAVCQEQKEPLPTFGTTVVISTGLRGLVYKIGDFTEKLPKFEKMKPIGTIYTDSLNIPPREFTEGFPGITKRFEFFAIDYTGRIWVEKPGMYRFALTSDDGSKLYIDDNVIIDYDGVHGSDRKDGTVNLTRGVHKIRVSYFQGPRFMLALVLEVAPPGEGLKIFTTQDFKPPSDIESWPADEPEKPKKGK